MADTPHRDVLDREGSASEAAQFFAPTLELMKEVVDYGTNLLVRCLRASSGEMDAMVSIAVLGKQVIAALDAVEQLASTGSALGTRVVARSMLEASLYCEWVLAASSKQRARAYYVADLRRELSRFRRMLPGSPQNSQLRADMGHLYEDLSLDVPNGTEYIENRILELETHLGSESFVEINSEFNRLRKESGREPRWHQVVGARTLRDVAKQVGRLADYTIFYSTYSDETHSSSRRSHLVVADSTAVLHPIRHLDQLGGVCRMCLTFAFRTYRALLIAHRPDELPAIARLFRTDWADRFNSVPMVDVEFKPRPPW